MAGTASVSALTFRDHLRAVGGAIEK